MPELGKEYEINLDMCSVPDGPIPTLPTRWTIRDIPEGLSKLPEDWFYPGDGGTIIERRGSSIIAKRADDECFLPEGYFYPGDVKAYRSLVAQVPMGGHMAELGCYKGRSLCSIAEQVKARRIMVEAVDTWHYAPAALGEFDANIRRFGMVGNIIANKKRSVDAARAYAESTFDLVFIDTPHDYNSVIADLRAWLPLVKPGGIIAGHDYCPQWPGVAKALDEMFGQVDLRARVNEEDYCVCWMKRVGLNAKAGTV